MTTIRIKRRWQDAPDIRPLLDELKAITGSESFTASLFGKGYWKNKVNADGTEEPGEFVPPSETRKHVEALKAEIRQRREDWITAGLRGEHVSKEAN